MAETAARRGERYAREQIVVDREHRQVVTGLLAETPLLVEESESITELGLTLLSVPDLEARGVDGLDDVAELREELRRQRRALKLPEEPSHLDVLMLHLRRTAAARYAGWVPVMGKNRDVEAIGGLPHIGGGDGLPQRPVGQPAFALKPRPAAGDQRSVRVGVLDAGLFPLRTLEGRVAAADFVEADPPFRPWHGHATFVVGRILRRAPGAELTVRRVLRDDSGRASSWDVAKGMAAFLGTGTEILNTSLGFSTADGSPGLVMERAVAAAAAEMVVVAAAGNHGDQPEEIGDPEPLQDVATVPRRSNSPLWPAAQPDVVAVGATDGDGGLAPFSPRQVPWVDLVAPGVGVQSTFLTGEVRGVEAEVVDGRVQRIETDLGPFQGTATWEGTSFAAADATGEIARLAARPGSTARQALREIKARRPGGGYDVHPPRW